jgi:hypothetical protein
MRCDEQADIRLNAIAEKLTNQTEENSSEKKKI